MRTYICPVVSNSLLFFIVILSGIWGLHTADAQYEGFRYKALITENGNPVSNHAVYLRFTLSTGGTDVYVEEQGNATDANGIVSVVIGEGSALTGDFARIDWSFPYLLKVEIDLDDGNGYREFGISELKWVPYAKFALAAGNTFSGNFRDLTNIPPGLADGDDVDDADHDATNEIQTLSLNNNTLSISNGNSVTLPGGNAFYKVGTNQPPSGLSDSIYTYGSMGIGTDNVSNGTLNIYSSNNNAIYLSFDNVNTYNQTAVYARFNNFGGTATGAKFEMDGTSGNQMIIGTDVYITGGTGTKYGAFRELAGTGEADQYGVFNTIYGNGGNNYNNYTGTANIINGSDSAVKYGTYNVIASTAGGKHYAVFGRAEKYASDVYAGYFVGKVHISRALGVGIRNPNGRMQILPVGNLNQNDSLDISMCGLQIGDGNEGIFMDANQIECAGSGLYLNYNSGNDVIVGSGNTTTDLKVHNKLLGKDSGNADMKAYMYGFVESNGVTLLSKSSDGFSTRRTGTGIYRIDFDDSSIGDDYIIIATGRSNLPRFINFMYHSGYVEILTYDEDGDFADSAFSFVVYRK